MSVWYESDAVVSVYVSMTPWIRGSVDACDVCDACADVCDEC